jgi:hypothetical protein
MVSLGESSQGGKVPPQKKKPSVEPRRFAIRHSWQSGLGHKEKWLASLSSQSGSSMWLGCWIKWRGLRVERFWTWEVWVGLGQRDALQPCRKVINFKRSPHWIYVQNSQWVKTWCVFMSQTFKMWNNQPTNVGAYVSLVRSMTWNQVKSTRDL